MIRQRTAHSASIADGIDVEPSSQRLPTDPCPIEVYQRMRKGMAPTPDASMDWDCRGSSLTQLARQDCAQPVITNFPDWRAGMLRPTTVILWLAMTSLMGAPVHGQDRIENTNARVSLDRPQGYAKDRGGDVVGCKADGSAASHAKLW